ncbi:hypothetical protein A8C32_14470 [Flavivirga aquatica]|uniref:NRDE family protein n=1 Tax=Flavivirga aquatica TaxID=1849968 RepID=A0A1E5TCI4_9FLAO|nr:NRDE family protein [Flavivirga aquatica]OEK09085.1 hypothetical protein A8C32_14470 [Flavivirga aquatica]
MCTVTIIPKGKNDFVLTSNRDEAPDRISLEPDFYFINQTKMLFPKDKLAGGTWIGLSEKNRLICLLNGGFECHDKKKGYRMSRGIVVKDFMLSDNIVETVKGYNFQNIEPFTIVILDWNTTLKLYELVWDGEQKHFNQLPLEPKIWSSSTLYSQAMKKERVKWFEGFNTENKLDSNTMLIFHKTAGGDNSNYGVVMDRGRIKTTSITQVKKINGTLSMRHESIQNKTVTTKVFSQEQIVNG